MARIGERGQVTIPKAYRERLGLTPDTPVRFVLEDGALKLVKEPESRRRQVGKLYGRKHFGRSTDELMKLLRE